MHFGFKVCYFRVMYAVTGASSFAGCRQTSQTMFVTGVAIQNHTA